MQGPMVDTIVRGGTVVTSSAAFKAAVAIKGEQIVAVGAEETLPPAVDYIDATGKYVLPGAIDCHLHLGGVDDWTVGPLAAARAGITTIVPFATVDETREEPLPDAVRRMKAQVSQESVVDFGFHFILPNLPYVLDGLPEAMEEGVSSFKLFMTYKKAGIRMCSDSFIGKAMQIVGSRNGLIQLHCENGEINNFLEDQAIEQGRTGPKNFPATCPVWSEGEAINRAILLGAMADCPVYVVHLSTKIGLEEINEAQVRGQRVMTETCPQYLLLTEEEMERLGPYAKIGPPLRPADLVNQNALWEGSKMGVISNIGSDHAPGPRERKELGWENVFVGPDGKPIPFGAPSVETLVPLTYDQGVVKRGMPIWWMARVLAENPARIFGLYPKKGVIQPGADADLLILDPDVETEIHAADHLSNAGYTPYEGWKIYGKPWMTLLRGRVLLKDGELEQQPGYGNFLPGGSPVAPVAGKA